jgi:hypothetical protein
MRPAPKPPPPSPLLFPRRTPGTGQHRQRTPRDLPTPAALATLDVLPVLDAAGNSTPFRALYADGPPETTQHLVVFLRHFLCGVRLPPPSRRASLTATQQNCQEYVRHLAHHLPPSALPATTRITLLSCGAPSFLAPYAAATGSPFALRTDPSGATYDALGLRRSLAPGPRPEYMRQSLAGTVVSGVAMGVAMGRDALRSGDHDRIGGEFLFRRDGEGRWACVWAHRMANTRDHAEIAVLRDVLGLGGVGDARKRSAMDGWAQFKSWVGAIGKDGATAAGTEKGGQNGVETAAKNGVET